MYTMIIIMIIMNMYICVVSNNSWRILTREASCQSYSVSSSNNRIALARDTVVDMYKLNVI